MRYLVCGDMMRYKLRMPFLKTIAITILITALGWLLLPKPHTARHHPLRYYISLPAHWSPDRSWPILVAIDGVNDGHFLWNFLRFQQARHDLPFILISPLVVSNSGHPDPYNYPYSPEVWAQVDDEGGTI